MKTIIAGLLLTTFAFAQAPDNSAAQQGIAIVEMMEKDGSEMSLPDFCKSTRKLDKQKCERWLKEQKSKEGPDLAAAHQGIAIMRQMEKDEAAQELPEFCKSTKKKDKMACENWMRINHRFQKSPEEGSMLDDFKESCADKKLSEEEKTQCMEYAEYMSHQPIEEDDERLLGCTMSPDSSEITCGDKVYKLSGQVSNGSRINTKIDLKGSSKSQKGKSSNSKANKQ